MASITLSGTLLDPNGDLAVGDQIRFTHQSTTGQTVKGSVSVITINPAGTYTLPLQFGFVLVEHKDVSSTQFKSLGVATVNANNPATSIPELLNALVPVSSAELIAFQAILADSVAAAATSEAFANQLTTIGLIGSSATFSTSTVISTSGYTASGDGGEGRWKQNGVTGQTPSQSPAQLGNALLNDGNGNQWSLTSRNNPTSYSIGMPTGVDDTVLLEALIKSSTAIIQTNNSPLISKSEICEVTFLSGSYILTRHVSNSSKVVTFKTDSSVNITGSEFLTGRIDKKGLHVNVVPTGIRETSQGLSVRALTTGYSSGNGLDDDGGTFGITDIDTLSIVGAGDSVGLTIQNKFGRNLRKITGTTFTATTVTYTGVLETIEENITVGSILYGKQSGVLGLIESVNLATKTITVQKQWYVQTGAAGSVGTPVTGEALIIDFYDKVWGTNTNVIIDANEETVNGVGHETGVVTLQTVSSDLKGVAPYMWGYDAVNLEPALDASIGFICRKNWKAGFASRGADKGFVTLYDAPFPDSIGFSHEGIGGTAFRSLDSNGGVSIRISSNGDVEYGAGDRNLIHDYRTLNADFDVRFTYSGGNAVTTGTGVVTIAASEVDFLGQASSTGFKTSGAIGFRALDSNSNVAARISGNGDAEFGAGDRNIIHDYRTLNADFDVRFNYLGGNAGATGQGTLQLDLGLLDLLGVSQADEYRVAGTRVVGSQKSAIPNATGGTEVATINAILTVMRNHGLIAT
jgi:hypothetical protein